MERPFIHVNFATDADARSDEARSISCATDWRRVHELREQYDAVAVGGKTWNCDRPRLTARSERLGREPRRQPARVVFAGRWRCSVSNAPGTTFVVGSTLPDGAPCIFVPSETRDLNEQLRVLARMGIRSMLVEGGPMLIRSFLTQDLADCVTLYVRTQCLETAGAAARNAISALPSGMAHSRLGEGTLLEWPRAAAPPCTQPVRFVIIAAPRTGSNMLCSMLNSHPHVLCHHELFNPEGIHLALDHRNGEIAAGTLQDRDRDPDGFLDRIWAHRCGAHAIGFKVNRGQNENVFRRVLTDTSIRKIVLVRRNRVETFLSETIAQDTGRWESYEFSARSTAVARAAIETRRLFDHVATNAAYYASVKNTLRSTGQDFLEIAYEDLAEPFEQKRLLSYLGVPDVSRVLCPATRKSGAADLRSAISNFDELEAALRDSELHADLLPDACAKELPPAFAKTTTGGHS